MSSQAQTETELIAVEGTVGDDRKKSRLSDSKFGSVVKSTMTLFCVLIAGEGTLADYGKKSLLSDSIAGEGAVADYGKNPCFPIPLREREHLNTHDWGSLYRKAMRPEPRLSQRLQVCSW